MATKIILTTDETLTGEEVGDLRYLFADALDGFASRRADAQAYVDERYPGPDYYPDRDEKVKQVERRVRLARKLHNAALTYKTLHEGPGLSMATLEEMAEAGERAQACILLLQDVFGMEPAEARATYNQLEDKRVAKLMAERGLVKS